MSSRNRQVKIVATLGPASDSEVTLEGLVRAGLDVVRVNFSHGTHQEHSDRIERVRAVAARLGRPIAVLQDLQGPKIRTGTLEGGRSVNLVATSSIVITTRDVPGNANLLSTTYQALPSDVQPGDPILLDDGRIRLRVLSSGGEEVLARVEHGGPIGEHKGINLPGVNVSAPAMTEKDRVDLAFGLKLGVDYVALSFIRSAADIEMARAEVQALGGSVPLITKLEKPQAIERLDSILAASDGVMVARGDLGVEMPPERVPMIQKQIIRKANLLGKPVITATQMLESMVNQPTPTRAEATDVANAVWDGTDAVMLSAESAIGQYPIETVQVMDRIIAEAEKQAPRAPERDDSRPSHAISRAARSLAEDLGATAVVCFTRTARTAQLLSQERPRMPIYAFTSEPEVGRLLALWWGVESLACAALPDTDALILEMERILVERYLVRPGELIIVVGAIPFRGEGSTNFLKAHQVG